MSRAHSDGNGGLYIHRSSVEKWIAGIVAVVIGGLLVTAISGNIVMYRQVGQLQVALTDLTNTTNALAATTNRESERARVELELIRLGQEQMKLRLTMLDRKLN